MVGSPILILSWRCGIIPTVGTSLPGQSCNCTAPRTRPTRSCFDFNFSYFIHHGFLFWFLFLKSVHCNVLITEVFGAPLNSVLGQCLSRLTHTCWWDILCSGEKRGGTLGHGRPAGRRPRTRAPTSGTHNLHQVTQLLRSLITQHNFDLRRVFNS